MYKVSQTCFKDLKHLWTHHDLRLITSTIHQRTGPHEKTRKTRLIEALMDVSAGKLDDRERSWPLFSFLFYCFFQSCGTQPEAKPSELYRSLSMVTGRSIHPTSHRRPSRAHSNSRCQHFPSCWEMLLAASLSS